MEMLEVATSTTPVYAKKLRAVVLITQVAGTVTETVKDVFVVTARANSD
jgi:hypothetical protein